MKFFMNVLKDDFVLSQLPLATSVDLVWLIHSHQHSVNRNCKRHLASYKVRLKRLINNFTIKKIKQKLKIMNHSRNFMISK
jgi:hypothetical protein